MHAIVESRPGDDAALYLLGNEQEVHETTKALTDLVFGGVQAGVISPETGEGFGFEMLDPDRSPHVISGIARQAILEAMDPTNKEACKDGNAEHLLAQLNTGRLTEEEVMARADIVEMQLMDFPIFSHQGIKSITEAGKVVPVAEPLAYFSEPVEFAPLEPVPTPTFTQEKEFEIAASVGAVRHTDVAEIAWEDGVPHFQSDRIHKALVNSDGLWSATILSPDHPVRANQPSNPPAA